MSHLNLIFTNISRGVVQFAVATLYIYKNYVGDGNHMCLSYRHNNFFPCLRQILFCKLHVESGKTWEILYVPFCYMILTSREPVNLYKAGMSQASLWFPPSFQLTDFNIFLPFHYLSMISVHLIAWRHFSTNSSLRKALYKSTTLWAQMFLLELTLCLLFSYFI